MSEKDNRMNLMVDGNHRTCYLDKIVVGRDEGNDVNIIKLKAVIDDAEYITESSGLMEFAVVELQRLLPENVQIVCCQTCRYGNFCPFGDNKMKYFV